MLTHQQREVRTEKWYFIPKGTVIEGAAVSISSWPDATPVTNWTDWELKAIKNVKPIRELSTRTITDTTTAGYVQSDRTAIKKTGWTGTTEVTNNLFKQLIEGLIDPVTAGVAQIPGARLAADVEGVFLREVWSEGSLVDRRQVWSSLSIPTPPDSADAIAEIGVQIIQLPADLSTTLNTYQAGDPI